MASAQIPNSSEFADRIIQEQVVEKTRKSYDSKQDRFKNWLRTEHPETIENNEIKFPLDSEHLKNYLGYISRFSDGRNKSIADVGGHISAINNYFRKYNFESPTCNSIVRQFMSGYKRTVATAKQTGEMKLTEGKRPFSFANFEMLCSRSLQESQETSVMRYAHLYLILCWNLMARSCSVSAIKYDHITWINDSLLITLPRHKGDQEGANCYPKHVFANPLNPVVCPILSLGIHLLSTSYRDSSNLNSYHVFIINFF
jgi:hypothetical protein